MKKLLLSVILGACSLAAVAQTTREEMYASPEKCGGVYYAYPVTESANTPAPDGYKPFYVSHYGRHGSRYLISDEDYSRVYNIFEAADKAGALTALGTEVYNRLVPVWEEAEGRGGELSPLGYKQHRAIASRMYESFPEVFAGNPVMTARSSTIMRCAHSMFAFCERLKEFKPSLVIPMESNRRNMSYLCYSSPESAHYNRWDGPCTTKANEFKARMTTPDRLMKSLFKDTTYLADNNIKPFDLMWGLYWIAVDMQNIETPVSFYDIFTQEELFNMWQAFNYDFYSHNACNPESGGLFTDNAKRLLNNILTTADQYIARGDNGATLRFGHDGNIIPLAALMQFDQCHGNESDPDKLFEAYADYKVSPMGANVQVIFFKNKKGGIIVKFMMNEREVSIPAETDMFPFYRWDTARAALQNIIDTPSVEFYSKK